MDSASTTGTLNSLALTNSSDLQWTNRNRKWLIDDSNEQDSVSWSAVDKAKMEHLKLELMDDMDMYMAAAVDAERKLNKWSHVQLVVGFVGAVVAFVNASSLPDLMATSSMSGSAIGSILSVGIGVLTIISTAIAERLKKKDFAVKANNFERVRVDYQGAHDLIVSEIDYPKRPARVLEAKIRRIMQDLEDGHIAHQPPPHIREQFGRTSTKIHEHLNAMKQFSPRVPDARKSITTLVMNDTLKKAIKRKETEDDLRKKGFKDEKKIKLLLDQAEVDCEAAFYEDKKKMEADNQLQRELKAAKSQIQALENLLRARESTSEHSINDTD